MLREEILDAELQSIDMINKKGKLVTITNIIKDDEVIHSIYDYEEISLEDNLEDLDVLCVKLKAKKEALKAER